MINGVHALIYTRNPEATRAFFKDVLGLPHVEAGRGWLIFALPPAELGIHPMDEEDGDTEGGEEGPDRHVLYLMCDDVKKTVEDLKGKGVEFTMALSDQGWGIVTELRIPGGGKLGLYQPRHPVAAGM
jgi:catechol 2,3-dioxygenase-like lactoylglutathione lyase family enzyme